MRRLKPLFELESPTKEWGSFFDKFDLPQTKTVLNNLKSIAKHLPPLYDTETFILTLLDHIRGSASPEQALNQTERFFSRIENLEKTLYVLMQDQHALQVLCTLFGSSPYLSGILIQNPSLFLWLLEEQTWNNQAEQETLVRELLHACREIKDLKEAHPILRHVKAREILRIGAKDLTGFSEVSETTEQLSVLAEAFLEAAYQVTNRLLRERYGTPLLKIDSENVRECRFVILAMGKLGGRELNFSSDIDLLYLYESDRGETTGIPASADNIQGKVENHRYFVKLSEGVTDLLHANTEDGFVFRVDLRLRPEGAHGPVASSLRSYEIYYESFGQTWERAALLKCRPVAGDLALGKEFQGMLRPFIYRKYLDFAAIDEIKEMKRKIRQELVQKPARGTNIKLDRGGIREIEFFIQSLQLIYGGRITWIRENNSLRALHRLCDKKLITYEDYSELSRAYIFLRNVEHKLQIENQLQLQTLPTDPLKLDQLARRCIAPNRETFLEEVDRHRSNVQKLFENLFYEKEGVDIESSSPIHAILGGNMEAGEIHEHLAKLGFHDPRQAHSAMERLMLGTPYAHTSSRCRSLFLKIAPDLFHELASSPDPDMALNHFERFISGYGAREVFYGLLGENPPALQKVIALFSISGYLSNLLIRHPDAVEVLFGEDLIRSTPPKKEIYYHLMEGLKKTDSGPERMDFLRRFKHMEEMKIGLRDILLDIDLLETSRSLSRLADASLEAAYTLALEELTTAYGIPQSASKKTAAFAILGAGKLGSREMTYGSDLDLLFLFTEDGESTGPEKITNRDFFTRLSSRIIAILSSMTAEGAAYRVDLRLRPLGEGGPLVQSLEGYQNYFKRNLQTWEHQAMTRVRLCAGNTEGGEKLLHLITETLYEGPPIHGLNQEILEMRKRIEKEKARPVQGLLFFKAGAGGLIDIEFLVQYMQLLHGREKPEIRSPGTLQVLETACGLGLLSQEDASSLKESYLFLRRLESRARIVQDRPISSLSSDPGKNSALALRMGYRGKEKTAAGQKLLDDYHSITRKTREIFLRILEAEM